MRFFEKGGYSVKFGEYLEECIKKRGIPVGTAASQIGINRGNLYSVFSGKRKISEKSLSRLVSFLELSNTETEKLYNKYFELEYGKNEFKRVQCIFDILNKMPDYYEAQKPDVGVVNDFRNLCGEEEILAAADYIIANSSGEITSNYSCRLEKLDDLFFYYVQKEGFRFRHLVYLPFDLKGTQDLENLFSCVRFMQERCFPYLVEVSSLKANTLVYPYFIVSEKYVMVFDEASGTVIESESFAETFSEKINEIFFKKAERVGDVPGDILEIKDLYNKSFVPGSDFRFEFGSYPCVAPYGDKKFFSDIAVDSMPEDLKNELVNVCYDHYQRMLLNVDIVHILAYDAIDKMIEKRVVDELPGDYCKLMNEEQVLHFLQIILEKIKEDKVFILDERCFHISDNLFIEINSVFFTLSGTDLSDENFMIPQSFYAVIHNKMLISAFRNFFDYILRSQKTLPKEVAIGHLENRIAQMKAKVENNKNKPL